MRRELSVIVPAYNEADRIAETLVEIGEHLRSLQYAFEVIVVDDGSSDRTAWIVENLVKKYPEIHLVKMKSNSGKGRAVKEGIAQARYGFCLFMDADNSTSIREWEKFEGKFEEGCRAVIASRHLPGSLIVFPQPWSRRFLGTGYRIFCRRLFGLSTSDLNCGFKAYETALAKEVYAEIVMNDWTFDLEVLTRLKKRGVDWAEVAVTWTHHDKKFHAPPLATAFRTFSSVRRLKKIFTETAGQRPEASRREQF